MRKKYFLYISEILILSLLIYAGIYFLNGKQESISSSSSESEQSFSSAYISNSAMVGIALSTKIGLGNGFISGDSSSSYSYVTFLGKTSEEKKQIRENLIYQNMVQIRDYLNFSKTNYSDVIKTSSDKKTTLETLITQLELRKSNAQKSIISLSKNKEELVTYIDTLSSQIETTKTAMQNNFSASKVDATVANVDSYFTLRDEYTQAFTDVVFINQFLKQYNFLIEYNEGILNTIKVNKQAIIDETYVVIPNSGDEYLKTLNLIINESDVNSIQE